MKKIIYIFLFALVATSCSDSIEGVIDNSSNRNVDLRPYLPCNRYNATQIDSINNALQDAVNSASTTRAKVVKAAQFITQSFPYAIPYAYETSRSGYKLISRYSKDGFFLSPVEEDGHLYQPWGCDVPTPTGLYTHVANLGDEFANGIHCSGFTNWCWYNAGIKDIRSDTTHADGYQNLPGVVKLDLPAAKNELEVGDFLYFGGHVALVMELKGDIVRLGESALWSGHTDRRNGVRWFEFNRATVDYSTFRFKSVLKMGAIYGES